MSFLSIERVVMLFTPTVFAPLSALAMRWLTVTLPGLKVTSGQLIWLEVVTVAGVIALAWKWLHGRALWTIAQTEYNKLPASAKEEVTVLVHGLLQDFANAGTKASEVDSVPTLALSTAEVPDPTPPPTDEQEFADQPPAELPESARTPDAPAPIPPEA